MVVAMTPADVDEAEESVKSRQDLDDEGER
jgi:hypothetical protein